MKQPLIASLIQIDQTLTVDLFSRWCNGRAVLWSTAGKLSDLWSRRSWPQINFSASAIIARPFLRLWLFLSLPWLHLLSWRWPDLFVLAGQNIVNFTSFVVEITGYLAAAARGFGIKIVRSA